MSDGGRIPQHQVERIRSVIAEVSSPDSVEVVPESLVTDIVELEVEFQFLEDRELVLSRIRESVEKVLLHDSSQSDGDSKQ